MRPGITLLVLAGILALAVGCVMNPPPVPVQGDASSVAELAGRWEGDYRGDESGRSGSIVFELAADRDTAWGDVLMIPVRGEDELWTGEVPPGVVRGVRRPDDQPLRIAFVRVWGGEVNGTLDPYRDPECGCVLETTFTGIQRENVIEGTYRSRHSMTGRVQSGRWQVRRVEP